MESLDSLYLEYSKDSVKFDLDQQMKVTFIRALLDCFL